MHRQAGRSCVIQIPPGKHVHIHAGAVSYRSNPEKHVHRKVGAVSYRSNPENMCTRSCHTDPTRKTCAQKGRSCVIQIQPGKHVRIGRSCVIQIQPGKHVRIGRSCVKQIPPGKTCAQKGRSCVKQIPPGKHNLDLADRRNRNISAPKDLYGYKHRS